VGGARKGIWYGGEVRMRRQVGVALVCGNGRSAVGSNSKKARSASDATFAIIRCACLSSPARPKMGNR